MSASKVKVTEAMTGVPATKICEHAHNWPDSSVIPDLICERSDEPQDKDWRKRHTCPGLPAVQTVSCEKQKPHMETKHHHAGNMGSIHRGCNRPRRNCDLSAPKRPSWAIYATLPAPEPQTGRPAVDTGMWPSYFDLMHAHADQFRFLLLNRP
jgi:hypothetical protein